MNNKDIVNYIIKIGQGLNIPSITAPVVRPATTPVPTTYPATPPTAAPAPAAPAKKSTQSALSFASVKRMQQKMQNLARNVISGTTTDMVSKSNESEDKSKKAFNDFIAENFIGELPENMRGVEWSKNPKITTRKQKEIGQTGIYELDVVMDTIERIGREKSELKSDGIWDWRTHNALKNILGFSHALLQLEGELGIPSIDYTKKDLESFKNNLNVEIKNDRPVLSESEKIKKAKEITIILSKILQLYSDYKQKVLSKQEYKNAIEGRTPFFTHGKENSNKDALTYEEDNYSKLQSPTINNITYRLPKGVTKNSIPLNALTSKDNYMKYMSSIGIKDPNIAFNIFKIIKKQIDDMKVQKVESKNTIPSKE